MEHRRRFILHRHPRGRRGCILARSMHNPCFKVKKKGSMLQAVGNSATTSCLTSGTCSKVYRPSLPVRYRLTSLVAIGLQISSLGSVKTLKTSCKFTSWWPINLLSSSTCPRSPLKLDMVSKSTWRTAFTTESCTKATKLLALHTFVFFSKKNSSYKNLDKQT
jgi:hypothetical protein